MGEKDLSEKLLEDYNDVFSDIINVLIFQGRQSIKPEALFNSGIFSQYRAGDGKLHELERDIAKHWKSGEVDFAIGTLEYKEKYLFTHGYSVWIRRIRKRLQNSCI